MTPTTKHAWIDKPWREGDYWCVRCGVGDNEWVTQGRNEYEAYTEAADSIATVLGVRASWYRRLIFRIFRV